MKRFRSRACLRHASHSIFLGSADFFAHRNLPLCVLRAAHCFCIVGPFFFISEIEDVRYRRSLLQMHSSSRALGSTKCCVRLPLSLFLFFLWPWDCTASLSVRRLRSCCVLRSRRWRVRTCHTRYVSFRDMIVDHAQQSLVLLCRQRRDVM